MTTGTRRHRGATGGRRRSGGHRRPGAAASACARGPGSQLGWPGMPLPQRRASTGNDREVELIVRTLRERGASARGDLGRAVGASQWGPGRFSESLRTAQRQGQARRIARARYEASERDNDVRPTGAQDGPPSRASGEPPGEHRGGAGTAGSF